MCVSDKAHNWFNIVISHLAQYPFNFQFLSWNAGSYDWDNTIIIVL